MQHHPWFSSALQVSAGRKAKLLVKKVKFPTPANIKVFQDYNRLFNAARAKAKRSHISSSLEIAAGFNEFYVGVGPKLAAAIPALARTAESYLGNPINVDFQFSDVSMETILNVSKLLQSKDSAGVDAISNNLLKLIVPTIISPLVHLINLSLKSSYIPVQVKMAVIIP
jgi:hypothetical protein